MTVDGDFTDLISNQDNSILTLRENAELFSKAFKTSPIAYAIASPENGIHYAVNDAWTELLGYTEEEAKQASAVNLGIWLDTNQRKKFVEILQNNGSAKAFETKFQRKNGDIIDVSVSGEYVSIQGKPRLFNVYDDITQRKKAESQLAYQTSIITLMKSIAYIANQSSNVKSALKQCLELICNHRGWQAGHVYLLDNSSSISDNIWYLCDTEKLQHLPESVGKYYSDFTCNTKTNQSLTSSNDVGTLGIAALKKRLMEETTKLCDLAGNIIFPIQIRDSPVAFLVFYAERPIEPDETTSDLLAEVAIQLSRVIERDNAETELIAHRNHLEDLVKRRTAEVEQQKLKLKQALVKQKELNTLQRQFVAMASHEFRTPLTIIDNAAQLLKRGAETINAETALKRSHRIREAVSRMTQLMESTLSAARLQDGEIGIEITNCKISELLSNLCMQHQEICPKHKISLLMEDLPQTIRADSNAVEQIITNLLSNAVKYAPDAPDIKVHAVIKDGHIVISIQDYGLGIDKDELNRIGERFFRARTSTGIAGTGIGLNLVATLVKMHDGLLDVKSKKNQGSTFSISLPICGPKQQVAAKKLAS